MRLYKLYTNSPSLIHLVLVDSRSLLCCHCCLLTLFRALWEGGSSMRNKHFVRWGESSVYVSGRLVCFALWWCSVCTLAIATALGVLVCLHCHCAAASVLGHVLIFTVLAWFCLNRAVPCHAMLTWVLKLCCAMPCWHGCWNHAVLARHGTVWAWFGCVYTSI